MEKFTQEELLQQRETIINLLRSTNRDGIERLIKFLDKSQYFFCWGSFKHHKYVGGLAEHSLQVCKIALEERKGNCDTNSIIIASLLHDICKVNYDFPVERGYYGHGTKSVQILEDYLNFKLTDEEWRAIRFHMGSKSYLRDKDMAKEFKKAQDEELWYLIHTSDCLSCGNYSKSLRGLVKDIISTFNL
jgi:HD superfamily phosphodiesterase